MKLRILIDMNLSPLWVTELVELGYEANHWSTIGSPRATDREIMSWAIQHKYIVFTHDLDFGTLLALTHATGPSVIQVRSQDVLPHHLLRVLAAALRQHERDLLGGALVVVDAMKCRVRILPL